MAETRRMRTRPRWWLALAQCAALLPAIRLMLWSIGYGRTIRLLFPGSAGPAASPPAESPPMGSPPPEVAEIASAVSTVARIFPVRSNCLARSITLQWLSRRRGHRVELLIGVAPSQQRQLRAHAWVEYAGIPVNDTADVRDRYVVIAG